MFGQPKQRRRLSHVVIALATVGAFLIHSGPASAALDPCAPVGDPPAITLAKAPEKLVGTIYQTGFSLDGSGVLSWGPDNTWGTPLCGTYNSDDTAVIQRHAQQLTYVGIDFIYMDLSHRYCGTDPACPLQSANWWKQGTTANRVADVFAALPVHPKVSVLTHWDPGEEWKTQAELDWIYSTFIQNPTRNSVYQYYQGKPLVLLDLAGIAMPYNPPSFTDTRFTIKWMTGWADGQNAIHDTSGTEQPGHTLYWSNKDRTRTTADGFVSPSYNLDSSVPASAMHKPEHAAVTSSFPGNLDWTGPLTMNRNGITGDTACTTDTSGTPGGTLSGQWTRVRNIDPYIATIASFNEWTIVPKADQNNAKCSTDFEPSVELGDTYMELMKNEITAFRKYRSDLLMRDTMRGIVFARNNPSFTFQEQRNWTADSATVHYQPFGGDFNGDGLGDLGFRKIEDGTIRIQFSPNFTDSAPLFTWYPGSAYQVFTGDFNGDKKTDIALRDSGAAMQGITYYRFAPDFSSLTQQSYIWPGSPAGAHYVPLSGDFNGDAIMDLALWDSNAYVWHFRLGPAPAFAGDKPAFGWSVSPGCGCTPLQPFTADINGDGIWDIGYRSTANGNFTIRYGPSFTGTGSPSTLVTWASGAQYQPFTMDVR